MQERNITQSPCGFFSISPIFMLCLYCSRSSTVVPHVAHLFLFISFAFYLPFSLCSISIVHFYTTRESCSLTSASDNWHSWDWTFLSNPIHMYSKQRDKSHQTHYRAHPPCEGCRRVESESLLFHQRWSIFIVGVNNLNPEESTVHSTDTDIH